MSEWARLGQGCQQHLAHLHDQVDGNTGTGADTVSWVWFCYARSARKFFSPLPQVCAIEVQVGRLLPIAIFSPIKIITRLSTIHAWPLKWCLQVLPVALPLRQQHEKGNWRIFEAQGTLNEGCDQFFCGALGWGWRKMGRGPCIGNERYRVNGRKEVKENVF